MDTHAPLTDSSPLPALSNAEIADRLASLAQLLSAQKENPYKVKAYRRAAAKSVRCRKAFTSSFRRRPISRAMQASARLSPPRSGRSSKPASCGNWILCGPVQPRSCEYQQLSAA